ncbi:hypothetical protein DD563_00740 [Pelagicola sp. LXJ1103]|nr:hypothetical protein DD563_00740 [Pelagicola sp. LXJ1103]
MFCSIIVSITGAKSDDYSQAGWNMRSITGKLAFICPAPFIEKRGHFVFHDGLNAPIVIQSVSGNANQHERGGGNGDFVNRFHIKSRHLKVQSYTPRF